MPETVLLTGATGFLGSHLLHRLVQTERRTIILKRSFSNTSRIASLLDAVRSYDVDVVPLSRVFDENKIDMIIHCATNYGRRPVPPSELIESNLILPLKLLEHGMAHHVSCFMNTDTILDKRVNYYSLSKRHFVDWLLLFSESAVCINVALEHFYGPFDDRSKFVTQVILDLLHKVSHIDLTAGEQRRDFIFIDDVVEAFFKIMQFAAKAGKAFYRYEVGSNQNCSIRDIVQMAKEITGNVETRLNFGALPYRANEIMESHVDTSALAQLGWSPRVSLIEGIARTIRKEREHLRP